jgi:putative membrane protein
MKDEGTDGPRFEVRSTSDSHFSWLRTRMSAERHAHVLAAHGGVHDRLSASRSCSFFEHFGAMAGVKAAVQPQAPRIMGLTLIAIGSIALVIAVWQYHILVSYLWTEPFRPITPRRRHLTPVYGVSIVMCMVGIFTFFAVYTRLGGSG